MSRYDALKEVTIVSVAGRYIGTGRIPYGDLLDLIKEINSGAIVVKLDHRFGGAMDRYVPVHQIAEIQVER